MKKVQDVVRGIDARAAVKEIRGHGRSRSPARILIVDDDPRIRLLCSRFLNSPDYEITERASGEEALGCLPKSFDIVLTDLDMPGSIDGNELARRARCDSSSDVIIMTGRPELETAVEALQDGACDYLIKPFGGNTLRQTIDRCLDKRRLSKELAREKTLRQELDRACSELVAMERVRETFGQFVTPEVARFALENPQAVRDEGKLQVLTVLFVDVRGFTPFAAKVSPRVAVAVLNQIFACAITAIQAEGGILNKFIGDGMMALFGAPVPIEDHAAAAARAALSAMKAIETLSRSREAEGLIPLRVGMGINTGEVVAGFLGTVERTEYSVIGDAVNVTSRLEGIAKPGQILVGPATAELLRPSFRLNDQGMATLKGRPQPIRVEEIVGAL